MLFHIAWLQDNTYGVLATKSLVLCEKG